MGIFDFLGDILNGFGGGSFSGAAGMNTPVPGTLPINDNLIDPETSKILSGLGSALGQAGKSAAGSGTGKYDQIARGLGSLAESLGGGKQQAGLYNKMAGVEDTNIPPNVRRITSKPDGSITIDTHAPTIDEKSKLATQQPLTQGGQTSLDSGTIQSNMQDVGQAVAPALTTPVPPPSPLTQAQSSLTAPMTPQMGSQLTQAMGGGQVPFLQALQRLQLKA